MDRELRGTREVWVTYGEAQRLIPFFKAAKKFGPHKEARESAGRILSELGGARDIDYSPFRGYQMFLKDTDYEFYMDALDAMEAGK